MIRPAALRALLEKVNRPAPRWVEYAVEGVTAILFVLVILVFTGLAPALGRLDDPLRILIPAMVVFTLVALALRDRRRR
ncbi:MAG: hypothetical protein V4707_08595 [Pseudomonadota bacterium]